MLSRQSEIRALLDTRAESMRMKDIERLMALYAPDIVYFDVVPPLQYAGASALRDRFLDWFGRWQSPISQELRDPNIVANDDMAAAHMLIRASGTLKDGREVGYWVRTSNCFVRSDHRWRITHEHVSLPVDLTKGGLATLDLVP